MTPGNVVQVHPIGSTNYRSSRAAEKCGMDLGLDRAGLTQRCLNIETNPSSFGSVLTCSVEEVRVHRLAIIADFLSTS